MFPRDFNIKIKQRSQVAPCHLFHATTVTRYRKRMCCFQDNNVIFQYVSCCDSRYVGRRTELSTTFLIGYHQDRSSFTNSLGRNNPFCTCTSTIYMTLQLINNFCTTRCLHDIPMIFDLVYCSLPFQLAVQEATNPTTGF